MECPLSPVTDIFPSLLLCLLLSIHSGISTWGRDPGWRGWFGARGLFPGCSRKPPPPDSGHCLTPGLPTGSGPGRGVLMRVQRWWDFPIPGWALTVLDFNYHSLQTDFRIYTSIGRGKVPTGTTMWKVFFPLLWIYSLHCLQCLLLSTHSGISPWGRSSGWVHSYHLPNSEFILYTCAWGGWFTGD